MYNSTPRAWNIIWTCRAFELGSMVRTVRSTIAVEEFLTVKDAVKNIIPAFFNRKKGRKSVSCIQYLCVPALLIGFDFRANRAQSELTGLGIVKGVTDCGALQSERNMSRIVQNPAVKQRLVCKQYSVLPSKSD